ncbi:unnamed protein product, partial [Ranitomeya imitator]
MSDFWHKFGCCVVEKATTDLAILGGYLFVQRLLPVPLLEEAVFQKLAVGLGVEHHSIFNLKRSHKFIFDDTSPYQYPTSTLLASESEWSSLPFTDPASGPSRVTLISSVHKTFENNVAALKYGKTGGKWHLGSFMLDFPKFMGSYFAPFLPNTLFATLLAICHETLDCSKKKRRRIDRSMIGEPMNFVHLTHIGSGDMGAGDGVQMAGPMQEQMRSKGGRDRQWNNSRI